MRDSVPSCSMTATADHPLHTKPARVLVIEDDLQVSQLIKRELERYNVVVLQAVHGVHGIWLAITELRDVIITDFRMPHADGGEVIECIKRNSDTRHIPIIVLTGFSGDHSKRRMHKLGVDAYFSKPVDFTTLCDTLRRFIELDENGSA